MLTALYFQSQGQTDIMEGGHVVIASGATLTSMVTIRIGPGGALQNDGMLCIKRDFHNENTVPQDLGPGIFNFCGETAQTLSGKNILGTLLMDNPWGLTLAGNTQVIGLLTLANGRVILGSFNLTLGMQAMVAGNPSAASMVVATSTGELRKSFAGPGTFQFPVGNASDLIQYSPVTLTFAAGSGTFLPDNYVGVSLANQKYPDPNITGSYLKRYWNLSHSGITAFSCSAWFSYLDTDVEGDEGLLACTRTQPLPWTTFEPANITDNILMATGITFFSTAAGGFSSFTGLQGSSIPGSQQLTNLIIGPGTNPCYAATQMITAGGNGGAFTVVTGGNVDLVAGHVVSFQPLAVVTQGGYLHAWISSDGQFCGSASKPIVAGNFQEEIPQPALARSGDTFLHIYPNPAADRITVEFSGEATGSSVDLVIYNLSGMAVLRKTLAGNGRVQVSLAGWPEGIFMVCARSGSRSEQAKIVRQQP